MTRHFYLRRFNSRCITCSWATALQCNDKFCMFYTNRFRAHIGRPWSRLGLVHVFRILAFLHCWVLGSSFARLWSFLSRKDIWKTPCLKGAQSAATCLSHSWDYYGFFTCCFGSGGLTDTNGKRGVFVGALMVYQRAIFDNILSVSFVVGVLVLSAYTWDDAHVVISGFRVVLLWCLWPNCTLGR